MNIEFVAGVISLVLTLIVFSYLIGDNFLYRWAVSIFIGLAAAYTTVVIVQSVLLPLVSNGAEGIWLLMISGVFALLLLFKPLKALRPITNFALAFLIAVGAAVAVVGAVSGTIIPIITSTTSLPRDGSLLDWVNTIVLLIGVISSLLYFQYKARRTENGEIKRGALMGAIALVGEAFIVVTLGAIYGAAILTSLSILTGQLVALWG